MDLPKISVIIPSYNKVQFVSQTLESIVSQKYSNYEVIIQDGGSTDGSVEIIKKYAKKYPKFIKWESKKDKGQVDAINKGLNKAKGEILTYINADDVYMPNAFESVAEAYLKNPDSLWFAGRGQVIDSKGKEMVRFASWYKNCLLAINRYPLIMMTCYLMQPSIFTTRKAWKKYGPFWGTREYVTEYDLWLKIGKTSMPIVISETLSSFRISKSNISSVSYIKLLEDDYTIVKRYTNNILILILHKIHNWARIALINCI